MSPDPLPLGKLPPRLLARLLEAAGSGPAGSGDPDAGVLLGPAVGEDACVLAWECGDLVVATDPITLTPARAGAGAGARAGAGRYAVTVNANDVAVTGARPRWFLATVLLPPGTTEEDVDRLFGDLCTALAEVGATLVGGHTEVTSAVTKPVVVGQMIGLVERGRALATGGASPGDVVVQIGPVPVEGAVLLALELDPARTRGLDPSLLAAAAAAIDDPGISVVAAALTAAELGATAMHDPTEGGLASALHELATAAGLRLRLDRDQVIWFAPGVALCRAFGADPWATLGSGAILAAFRPDEAHRAIHGLRAKGFDVASIALAEEGPAGVVDTAGAPLAWPDRDELSRLLDQQ